MLSSLLTFCQKLGRVFLHNNMLEVKLNVTDIVPDNA